MRSLIEHASRRMSPSVVVVLLSAGITGTQGLAALLTAKWLGATERGVISVAQTMTSLTMLVLSLGLLQGSRILIADRSRGITQRAYLRATHLLTGAFAVVMSILAVTLFPWLTKTSDFWVALIWVLWAVALFRSSLLREMLHGAGRHARALLPEFVGGAAAVSCLAVWHFGDPPLTLTGAFLCLGGAVGVQYGIQTRRVRRSVAREAPVASPGRAKQSRVELLQEMVRFSLPGLVAAAGTVVAARMDQLILAVFHGPKAVGVYAMASTLSDLAWTLPIALSAVMVRRMAQASRDELRPLHRTSWRRTLVASMFVCSGIMAVGWWLLERYLGADFHGSAPVLAVLLIGSLAMASQQVDLSVCFGLGDLKAGAESALWGVGVGLAAYLALIPPLGVLGCALGNDLTCVSMAVAARVIMRKRVKEAGVAWAR